MSRAQQHKQTNWAWNALMPHQPPCWSTVRTLYNTEGRAVLTYAIACFNGEGLQNPRALSRVIYRMTARAERELLTHQGVDRLRLLVPTIWLPNTCARPHDPSLVFALPRAMLPGDSSTRIGEPLVDVTSGSKVSAPVVISVTDDRVVVDQNEPGAAKPIFFEIEVFRTTPPGREVGVKHWPRAAQLRAA
jgi:hypothetical protein